MLGADGEWIELYDPGRRRYRAAVLDRRRLQACLFTSAEPIPIGRDWLVSLFGQPERVLVTYHHDLAGHLQRAGWFTGHMQKAHEGPHSDRQFDWYCTGLAGQARL